MQALAGALPSPPLLAFKVLKVVRHEPLDFAALTRIIATDPSLSSALIKRSNSSRLGVRRPITDLSRALIVLGRDAVIELVLADAMRSLKASTRVAWPAGDEAFWKHSVAVAIAARMLAQRTGMPYPEEAFTCGLLHDFGKLVMLHHSGSAYAQLIEEAATAPRPLFKLEQQRIGHNHATIGGIIGRHWRMPDSLVHAIEFHHEPPDIVFGTLGNLVRSANLLVKIADIGHSGSPYILVEAFRRMPHARLSPKDLLDTIVELPARVDELASHILGAKPDTDGSPPPDVRPPIFIDLSNEEHGALVGYLALSLGYTPYQPGTEADASVLGPEHEYSAVITDKPAVCEAFGPLIDWAEWSNSAQATDGFLHLDQLRDWLDERLGHAVAP